MPNAHDISDNRLFSQSVIIFRCFFFYFSETTRPNFFNYKINIYENIGLFICIFVAWIEVHSAHFRQVRKSFCYDFDYAKRHGFALCREFCWILCGHFGWLAHHTKSEMYYICIIPSSIECVQHIYVPFDSHTELLIIVIFAVSTCKIKMCTRICWNFQTPWFFVLNSEFFFDKKKPHNFLFPLAWLNRFTLTGRQQI